MSQKTLEELAAEHVLLAQQGAYNWENSTEYNKARAIYTEILDRFGYDQALFALTNAAQAYKILVPKT